MVIHEIANGESIYSLCEQYSVNFLKVASENGLPFNKKLAKGRSVIISTPDHRQKLGEIEVNGFVMPGISKEVLDKTLPYLTYISVYCHKLRPDGFLREIDDAGIIRACGGKGVSSVMVIANIGDNRGYDGTLARTVLFTEKARRRLVDCMIKRMEVCGYEGLCLDFEELHPADGAAYNSFLAEITPALKEKGYFLMTAAAPWPTSGDKDYMRAAYAGRVISMNNDFVDELSPVSPMPSVRLALKRAVKEIPSTKILLGVPNYGFDCPLPRGCCKPTRIIGNREAADLAGELGCEIRYDEKLCAAYFECSDAVGRRRKIWFDDARSLIAKLLLIPEYNLGGCSIWAVNKYFPQLITVLDSMYDITKLKICSLEP